MTPRRHLRLLATPAVCLALLPMTLATPAAHAAQAASTAQETRDTLDALHVATMKYVSTALVSPDGKHVAYVLGVPHAPRDEDDGPPRSELHVLAWDTGRTRVFVTAESGVRNVQWTPDSQRIAFLAQRDGDDHRSLYTIPVDGGEAQRVLQLEDRGIGSYAFAPASADQTGERVALLTTAPWPKSRETHEKQGFKPEVYEEDWRAGEIWIAELAQQATEPRQIELDAHASGCVWSPDGSALAVYVAPTSLVDHSYVEKRVWIIDAASGEVSAKVHNRGKLEDVSWSPAGDALAMIAAFDEHDGSAARLLLASLTAPEKQDIAPTPLLGERQRDEHQVVFSAEDTLVVLGSQGAWSTLDAYTFFDGRVAERKPLLPLEGPIWTSMSASADGRRIALVGSTPQSSSELYTLDVTSKALLRRTDSNPWLADLPLARQEVISYPARDGLRIEGILIHPLGQGTNPAPLPAPLIVCVHGGPEAHQSNGWLTRYSSPGQVAAASGYAVFYPNYRGSTGRGLAYLKSSQGDPAGSEFDDVVDGVDYLIAEGIADPERVGVTGGSYGGYATAWMSTFYSARFAAGVMSVGISNKISKVGTTDIADEEFLVHAMKRPWDDWQFFLERSPIYYADRGQTPLLILHGKEDTRVDPGQSREMYRHLKLRGQAPVRLVNYPGEGHGNRNAGARFDYNLRMQRWFDHYLQGEGGEPPPRELDYDAQLPAKPDPEPTPETAGP